MRSNKTVLVQTLLKKCGGNNANRICSKSHSNSTRWKCISMVRHSTFCFYCLYLRKRKLKIFGIPNRLTVAIFGSAFCVFIEVLLNDIGALTWEYSWWDTGTPWLIFLFGYLHFFLVSFWVFDMESLKKKVIVVGLIYTFDVLLILVFGVMLKWI